jgi:hypothetical protein
MLMGVTSSVRYDKAQSNSILTADGSSAVGYHCSNILDTVIIISRMTTDLAHFCDAVKIRRLYCDIRRLKSCVRMICDVVHRWMAEVSLKMSKFVGKYDFSGLYTILPDFICFLSNPRTIPDRE